MHQFTVKRFAVGGSVLSGSCGEECVPLSLGDRACRDVGLDGLLQCSAVQCRPAVRRSTASRRNGRGQLKLLRRARLPGICVLFVQDFFFAGVTCVCTRCSSYGGVLMFCFFVREDIGWDGGRVLFFF